MAVLNQLKQNRELLVQMELLIERQKKGAGSGLEMLVL